MGGGIEQRVYMHWKSLKLASPIEWAKGYDCELNHKEYPWLTGKHMHGYHKTTTANHIWLHLARVHKMPVRQVKDIINKKRGK